MNLENFQTSNFSPQTFTELAANLFRANKTHFEVGKKVRQTIEELGGTMPEDLPVPEEDLKKLERQVKSAEKKLIK